MTKDSFDGPMKSDTLKVLHVTASMAPEWGGPPVTVAGLTAALERYGVHSEIVTTTGLGVGTHLLPTPHVVAHPFPTEFPACIWPAYSRKLARFLEHATAGFDVIHIHEIWHYPGYVASSVARRHDIPYVVSLHGELDERRLRHKWFKKWMYRKLFLAHILRSADALHAVAQKEQTHIARLGYKVPMFVSPNGISLDQLDDFTFPETSGFLGKYPQLIGKRVVLFLGRIHSLKGLDVLARSFIRIASRFGDVTLLIAGQDQDGTRDKVEGILRTAGMLDRVLFTGMLTGSDKLAACACADLFVLSSYSEGFSIAVIEALAAGLPVVISEQCNFPEVAEAGAGFVVPAEDEPVVRAISALLSDIDLSACMGRNGRRLVMERYTWPAIAESTADCYRTLITKREACRERGRFSLSSKAWRR